MFETDNEYEEAIKGASIHAYEYRRNSIKRILTKLLSLTTGAVLLYVGFNYYKEDSLQEVQNLNTSSESLAKNILDNSFLAKEVSNISSEGSLVDKSKEDEYLSELQQLSNILIQNRAKRDEYLIALENMKVDILDDSQPKSISSSIPKVVQTTDLNQNNLTKAMNNIVDEAITNSSNYTNYLKKEFIVSKR